MDVKAPRLLEISSVRYHALGLKVYSESQKHTTLSFVTAPTYLSTCVRRERKHCS